MGHERRRKAGTVWWTRDELEYLDSLVVRASAPGYTGEKTPKQLIASYLANAEKRKAAGTWGRVDADAVISRARQLLRTARGI